MDLTLIPIEDLLKECGNRCGTFISAYNSLGSTGDVKTFYGKGIWIDAVGLSAVLQNDVLNNWNGELQILHKISEDMKDEPDATM
jgi:hypothetical protein